MTRSVQATIVPILAGQTREIISEQKPAIDRMFALWGLRSRFRNLEHQEIELKGIAGNTLTKEQEENLEANGYAFARAGGKIPARQINGIQLQMRIAQQTNVLAANVARWGIVVSSSGEFIVPDVPLRMLLPLSPTMALVGSAPDGMITEQNLAEINRSTKAESREYFFARDLSKCPL